MLSPADFRVLVIGGGIAGASVAYFAARAGWSVTVIDAGRGRASDVPTALLNPVRGQSGHTEPRALYGLRFSWALIGELTSQGYAIPHEQSGVLRPVASDAARARFELNLPPELSHRWLPSGEAPAPLPPGWPHLLSLPEGGWVAGPALVSALLAASGAEVRRARAIAWTASGAALEGGEVLRAEAVVWCGGSVGASWGGVPGLEQQGQTHRGGSVLLLDRPPAGPPLSAGVYLAPTLAPDGRRGGLLGATFEAPSARHHAAGPPLKSLHWLLDRASALVSDFSPSVTGLWSGCRLSGERAGQQPGGWWTLTGLGSKGFLLGPLLARNLVQSLCTRAGPAVDRSPSSLHAPDRSSLDK